ncbi:MAG: molybdopterin oxidoreductase family protein [Acidimicrobiia bacterium]|nr:molybdopterin oxidoreductase family protein [Acidimicrobiia bacterium]
MADRTHVRTCPLCEATCGLELDVVGEKVRRIRGDRADVFSAGYLCPKGTTLGRLHEDPDRLRSPLVKRDGAFVEVSWDVAFEAVAAGLGGVIERHGRQAVAAYLGNPNVHNLAGSFYLKLFLKALGTTNIYSASTVDQMPKHVSCGLMFGDPLLIPVPDLDRTDYLLMLGADPHESNGSLATAPDWPGRMQGIRDRGGKVVVVDPRRSKSAKAADEHLFITPGTDAALLVGMVAARFEMGTVATPDLVDPEAVERLSRAAAAYPPERVAGWCGIEAATIRRLAAELTASPTGVVYGRMGTHTTVYGTLASWLADVLNVLTGNLDRPGGAMFPEPAVGTPRAAPGGRGFTMGRYASRVSGRPEVRGELPVVALPEEIESPGEGQVRALVVVAGNPARSTPDSGRLEAALTDLEFMVSVDPYLNETAQHADVVLPPPSVLERSHYDIAFGSLMVRNTANYSSETFAKPDGHPDEWEILMKLAAIAAGSDAEPASMDEALAASMLERATANPASPAHGVDRAAAWTLLAGRSGPERLLDIRLRAGVYGDGFGANPEGLSLELLELNPHGIDLGPLQPRLPRALQTEDGRIHLAPEVMVDDLARLDQLAVADPDQMLLIGRRHIRSNNSWMHNIEVLVKGRDRCTLQMHSSDADALGVADGQAVEVRSAAGMVSVPVEVTDDIMAGVVSLPHGWGHDARGSRLRVAATRPGVNANLLTDGAASDPVSGNARLNGVPVTVSAGV